jgi:hypothetical protein
VKCLGEAFNSLAGTLLANHAFWCEPQFYL